MPHSPAKGEHMAVVTKADTRPSTAVDFAALAR